ncbi:GGDEF domain-containing protein [Catenovulum sediminis]|uniref:diguanylate cyclase n=1 Tax=Catenovulum sediminis TaxID=1740262 RepID=A0ABV1RDD2_9ALTE
MNGQLKAIETLDWLDVVGEGGIILMTSVWIFFIFASRPPGRVTTLLIVGLCCFLISGLLDLLDEFVSYPNDKFWLYWVESLPAFFGMFLMTWALYQWHQEQFKLNQQLCRREAFYREHSQIDFVTQLYRADYMRTLLTLNQSQNIPYSLAMLDIDNFAAFNRRYNTNDGDRLLREVAEITVMNLRQNDLACRYAGDRFILFFPQTHLCDAKLVVQQITQAISHLAFKPQKTGKAVYHDVSYALAEIKQNTDAENAIAQVNQKLEQQKMIRQAQAC